MEIQVLADDMEIKVLTNDMEIHVLAYRIWIFFSLARTLISMLART
jgi:hypothetical protein